MISYSLTINSVSYDCEIGANVTLDGTEQFDSGMIEIKNITKADEFTEADDVVLTVGSSTFSLIVQADRVDRITETLYDHTLTLTEETAKLTKLYAPDRYFTLNGTSLFTHWQIMLRMLLTTNLWSTIPYTVATATQTALGTNSPQKKFEGMNFFQIATDLMRGIKAVPRMSDNEISHTYYNEFNNAITLGDLNGWQKNRDFNNYATNIVSNAKNITYDLDETTGATWWPSKTEAATPRSSQGQYTDDTAQYQLGLDIRRTLKVELINIECEDSVGAFFFVDMDISDYVVSKEEWNGLPIGTNVFTDLIQTTTKYQRNTLYYEIGSNTIEGMGIEFKSSGLLDTTHFEVIMRAWLYRNSYDPSFYLDDDINNRLMRVQYQPYVNATISSEKWATSVSKISEILNNQKDTTLDVGRYGVVMNTIANRLANGDWVISINHDDETELLELYDYTSDGYKVIKASYDFYPSEIIGTYQLSLRWASLDGYQSVYKNTDPYTIGRDNVESNFKYTEYLEFSTTNRTNTGSLTTQGIKTLFNIFDYASADDLQADVGILNSAEVSYDIAMNVMSTGGSGMRFITKFTEVSNAGYELDRTGDDSSSAIPYTDETGYMVSFEMEYCDDYSAATGREDEYPKLTSATYTSLIDLPSLTVYKNPNEVFGFNYELLPSTDESDVIFVYNDFSKFNNLVNDGNISSLTIYEYAGTVQFDEFDTLPKSGGGTNPIGDATIDKTNGYIDVSLAISSGSTWAIGTADTLFMAVNYDGTDRRRIYINNLSKRSTTESL